MKANKALKRLTKIEGLMSDVLERYVTLAPAVRKALHDAVAAVAVAKEVVSLDVSSGTAKNSPRKQSGPSAAPAAKKAAAKAPRKPAPTRTTAKEKKTAP